MLSSSADSTVLFSAVVCVASWKLIYRSTRGVFGLLTTSTSWISPFFSMER